MRKFSTILNVETRMLMVRKNQHGIRRHSILAYEELNAKLDGRKLVTICEIFCVFKLEDSTD